MLVLILLCLVGFWTLTALLAALVVALRFVRGRYTVVRKSAVVRISVVNDPYTGIDRLHFLCNGQTPEEVRKIHAMVAEAFEGKP